MKPLTIEELKALEEVGDWVWVIDYECGNASYWEIDISHDDDKIFLIRSADLFEEYSYSDYGKTWLAYKNKEQAEAKPERYTLEDSTYYEKALVRLQELENKEQAEAKEKCVICHKDISNESPKIDTYGNHYCDECYSDKCEKELLQEKKAKGEIVELPCKPNDIVYYVTEVDDGNDIYFTIMNGVVDCFNIETGCKELLARYDGGLTYWHRFLDFGKEVFTSKSEAERRLAELRGEK